MPQQVTPILFSLTMIMMISARSSGQPYESILRPEDQHKSFPELAEKINSFYRENQGIRNGYKQWKRQEWFTSHHLDENGNLPDINGLNIRAMEDLDMLTQDNSRTSPNGNWTNLTGYVYQSEAVQGRVNSFSFDPLNAQIIYLATAGGGLWKSLNNGGSWFNLTLDLPVLGFADIAVAPAPNNNIIYALPGDISGGTNVYIHNTIGVIKSYNAGATWKRTGMVVPLQNGAQGFKLLVHPTDGNTVLAAMSDGIHRSTDGGNTWTTVAAYANVNDMEFHPANPNLVYFCVLCSNLVYTLNLATGAITSKAVPATFLPVNRMEIGVTPANSNAIYVQAGPDTTINGMNSFRGLFVSNNGGPFTMITNVCAGNESAFGNQSSYNNVIFIDPNNSNTIMLGGVNLYRATDGGVTLNRVTANAIHADNHNLKYNPSNGNWWLSNDGGVYLSTDNGASWTNKSTGLIIHEYYRIGGTNTTEDLLIGGTQDNGFFLRFVAGNLLRVLGGDGMDCYFNSAYDSVVYACTQEGGLQRSINSGVNFGPIFPPNGPNPGYYPWISPIVQHPPSLNFQTGQIENTDVIYIYSYSGVQRSSSDILFTSWTNIGPYAIGQAQGSRNPSLGIGRTGGITTLYVSDGQNFKSCDDPLNGNEACWQNRPLPISANAFTSAMAVNPWNREEVWVTISGYLPGVKVFRTQNGGLSWMNLSLGLPNIPVYSIVFANPESNPSGAVYIGTELGVFYTDDLLPDWVPFMNGLPHVPVTDLSMNYVLGKLKAATYGRGIWESDGYNPCPFIVNIDYPIDHGQYHFESSQLLVGSSSVSGGIGTELRLKSASVAVFVDGFHVYPDSYLRVAIGNCGTGPLAIAPMQGTGPVQRIAESKKFRPTIPD